MSKYLAAALAPPEQGGQGLTPLAASYEKYPYRRFLVEGAGPDIQSQIKYAQNRHARTANQPPPPPQPLGQPAADVALSGPPAMPQSAPMPAAPMPPIQTGPQAQPPGLPPPPASGPGGY